MQIFIPYRKCAVRFNVSLTIIVLLQFKKNKLKKRKKLNISKMVNFIKKCMEQKRCRIKFSFSYVLSNCMYLPPILFESDLTAELAAILNLTSRPSKVKSDWPPHLKIIIMVYTNYGKNFMFSPKSAQFLQ